MLKSFIDGYIECALFCGLDDDMRGEEYLLSLEFKSQARRECAIFYRANKMFWNNDETKKAGNYFWYTRNGHGVGFWDGEFENGELLSAVAKSFCPCDLYIGDDGLIYGVSG